MSRSLIAATFIAGATTAVPAYAEISPAEVWEDLKAYMESFGYEVSADVSGGGSALTAADVVMTFPMPEDTGTIIFELGTMTLTESGEGVAIGFAEVMPIRFDVTEDGERATGTVEYRHTGLDMVVSGSPQDLTYTYDADALSLELTELEVDGTPVGREIVRVDITMEGVEGATEVDIGSVREIAQNVTMAAVRYDMFFTEPDSTDNLVQLSGETTALSATSQTTLPLAMDAEDVAAMMASGLATDTDVTFGAGTLGMNVTEDGEVTAIQFESEGGSADIDLTDTAMGYGATYNDVAIQVAGAELPFPVALEAAEYGMSFTFPVAKADAPSDFGMSFKLADFEMNDMLWNMFDPAKALPRDPATLALALNGKARMLFDIFDPAQAEALENAEMPAEVDSLDISDLTVRAAGAEILGKGSFVFDNADLTTFDGLPRPEGSISLEINGANALIDTLVNMGLLPEEQAMGARMMMAMFAQPVGDDAMTSEIEINADGHILANGMRIQ